MPTWWGFAGQRSRPSNFYARVPVGLEFSPRYAVTRVDEETKIPWGCEKSAPTTTSRRSRDRCRLILARHLVELSTRRRRRRRRRESIMSVNFRRERLLDFTIDRDTRGQKRT